MAAPELDTPFGVPLEASGFDPVIDDLRTIDDKDKARMAAEIPFLDELAQMDHPIGSVRVESDLLVPSGIIRARTNGQKRDGSSPLANAA